ncbi:hypothetical protein PbJCM13498_19840 [Prolixibacter bellariivorans]|uniref:SPOR domain-containing protein n=1 Tax=Prolixibacter bellariivorans TaxID=314319 RepID=A0A5M4AZP4_9BACT|nr:SPOR domain-containing protein [Prolixibacter bellariivorans]GET33121.1 hypothetical protein PbJCM13498_19840 [Prolixibacter bellariivorans]
MKSILSTFVVLLLFWGNVLAQKPAPVSEYGQLPAGDTTGVWTELNIHQNPKTEELLERQIRLNKNRQTTPGYRVQIYFGSGSSARIKAMKVKTDFLSSYPEVKAYIIYQSPDFKVRVGDFRTRSEALRLQKKMTRDYPNAFIVPDEIQFPDLYSNSSSEN